MKNFLFLTLFCAFYSNASDFKLILNNKDASPLSTSSSDDWIDLLLIESNNNSTTVYSDTTQKAPKKIGGVVMYKQIEHLVKTDNNISKRPTPILIEEVKINKRKQLSEQVVEENRNFLSRLNINNLTRDEIKKEELQDKIFYANLNNEHAHAEKEYGKKVLEVAKKRKYTK